MNCYNECNNFFAHKTQENLGDITKQGSCAYCLYWGQGPARADYQYSHCSCNGLMDRITNSGKTLNVTGYEDIKNCLSKGKECGVLYSNWTNTEPSGPILPMERDPMYFNGCSKRVIGNQGRKYTGVF